MPIPHPHAARLFVREPKGNGCERRGGGGALADSSYFGLLGEQSSYFCPIKVVKMCYSLPWTPIIRRAKFDAASCNRTNKQTQTNSKRYIRTLATGMCG